MAPSDLVANCRGRYSFSPTWTLKVRSLAWQVMLACPGKVYVMKGSETSE